MNKFYLVEDGKQIGPFSVEELSNKGIHKETLVWAETMDNWTPAEQIPLLKDIIKATPPPIPKQNKNGESKTKECPYCAEEINIDAVKCKYCGEILIGKDSPEQSIPKAEASSNGSSSEPQKVPNASILLPQNFSSAIFISVIAVIFSFLSRSSGSKSDIYFVLSNGAEIYIWYFLWKYLHNFGNNGSRKWISWIIGLTIVITLIMLISVLTPDTNDDTESTDSGVIVALLAFFSFVIFIYIKAGIKIRAITNDNIGLLKELGSSMIFAVPFAFLLFVINHYIINDDGIVYVAAAIEAIPIIIMALIFHRALNNKIKPIPVETTANKSEHQKQNDREIDPNILQAISYLKNLLDQENSKRLLGKSSRTEILDFLNNWCSTKEKCITLINEYNLKYKSNLIEDIKKISSSYDSIIESLNVFISFGIVEEKHPHNIIDESVLKPQATSQKKTITGVSIVASIILVLKLLMHTSSCNHSSVSSNKNDSIKDEKAPTTNTATNNQTKDNNVANAETKPDYSEIYNAGDHIAEGISTEVLTGMKTTDSNLTYKLEKKQTLFDYEKNTVPGIKVTISVESSIMSNPQITYILLLEKTGSGTIVGTIKNAKLNGEEAASITKLNNQIYIQSNEGTQQITNEEKEGLKVVQ